MTIAKARPAVAMRPSSRWSEVTANGSPPCSQWRISKNTRKAAKAIERLSTKRTTRSRPLFSRRRLARKNRFGVGLLHAAQPAGRAREGGGEERGDDRKGDAAVETRD